jgi:hypothetical protein
VAKPSFAAYGDSANIWGATTNTSGECETSSANLMLTGAEWEGNNHRWHLALDEYFYRGNGAASRNADALAVPLGARRIPTHAEDAAEVVPCQSGGDGVPRE